jgi:dTDP-glucose 4,6-dehydratase/UDP-glucuronate decarboxylase
MYDEGKRFGEAMVAAYVRSQGVDGRIVRIFNTYGPGSDPADGRMVPNFVTRALSRLPLTVYGNGAQTRSLCYVSDMVSGLIAAMESSAARGQVTNLGNPEEHTVLEFAHLINTLCGNTAAVEFVDDPVGDDPSRRRPDITLAGERFGWGPRIGLEEGLRETITWFREELEGSRLISETTASTWPPPAATNLQADHSAGAVHV